MIDTLYVAYFSGTTEGAQAYGFTTIRNASMPKTEEDIRRIRALIEESDSTLSSVIPFSFYQLEEEEE